MKIRGMTLAFWLGLVWLTVGAVAVQAVVTTTVPRNDYTGTGATATYSYTFRIFDASDLLVIHTDAAGNVATLTYPTHYTVTGVNKAAGGTITLTAGVLGSGEQLAIKFNRTPRQSTDLRNQGSFLPETHESKFDELTRYIQALEEKSARSLKQPANETGTAGKSTLPANRASKYLAFDASSNLVASAGTDTVTSGFIQTLLDDASAADARTTLGAVGLTGNETIAGVKTFSSNPLGAGGVTYYPVQSGSWTPSLGGNTTYTSRSGTYYKIGPVYFIIGFIQVNTLGTGSASTISGLPTTVLVNDFGLSFGTYSSLATNVTSLYGRFNAANTTIGLFGPTAAAAANTGTTTIFGNGTSLTFTGFYIGLP